MLVQVIDSHRLEILSTPIILMIGDQHMLYLIRFDDKTKHHHRRRRRCCCSILSVSCGSMSSVLVLRAEQFWCFQPVSGQCRFCFHGSDVCTD